MTVCLVAMTMGCGGAAGSEGTSSASPSNAAASAGAESDRRTLSIGRTLEGMAGGPIDAATLGEGCVGWVPGEPQVVIEISEPTAMAITVTSLLDTTLVVASADGRVACNDDTIGLNPRIETTLTPGRHRVFVGTYDAARSGTFRIEAAPSVPVVHLAGITRECGLASAEMGVIRLGMPVVLGAHSAWNGPDGHGAVVAEDTWWNDRMWTFVGSEGHVTESGLDPVGCPYVRVDVDGGAWGWRIRDLRPAPSTEAWLATTGLGAPLPPYYDLTIAPAFTGPGIAGVPGECGLTSPDHGPLVVGAAVVLGAHTPWTGPDGHGGAVTDDRWWNDAMESFVGRVGIITELGGLDPVGCPFVRVELDGGSWGWRIRDLRPAPTP